MTQPPTKPDHISNPPENFIYADTGDKTLGIPLSRFSDDLAYYDEIDGNWKIWARGTAKSFHYAIRRDSDLHKMQDWYQASDKFTATALPEHIIDYLAPFSDTTLEAELERRRKPRTRMIGNREVPMPITEKPEKKTWYNCSLPDSTKGYSHCLWLNDEIDNHRLANGLIFATAEDAIANTEAILEMTRIENETRTPTQ